MFLRREFGAFVVYVEGLGTSRCAAADKGLERIFRRETGRELGDDNVDADTPTRSLGFEIDF